MHYVTWQEAKLYHESLVHQCMHNQMHYISYLARGNTLPSLVHQCMHNQMAAWLLIEAIWKRCLSKTNVATSLNWDYTYLHFCKLKSYVIHPWCCTAHPKQRRSKGVGIPTAWAEALACQCMLISVDHVPCYFLLLIINNLYIINLFY